MRYNRTRIYPILVGILLVLGMILVSSIAAEEPAQTDTQGETGAVLSELQIMSKVFEESLNRTSLKNDWKGISLGSSVFDPLIKYQYIPTVGAIFTIPVSFLIVEPPLPEEEEKPEAKPEVEQGDLWKKFTEEKKETGRKQINVHYGMDPMKDKALEETMKNLQADIQEKLKDAQAINSASVDGDLKADIRERVKDLPGSLNVFANSPYFPPAQYKKEQVEILRKTIIEALAQYGHNMKSLKDSERILVVIEAPASRAGETPGDPTSIVKTHRHIIVGEYNTPGAPMGPLPVSSVFGDSETNSQRDRRLLSVEKEDIKAEINPGELEGKIEEIFY